MAHRNVRHGFVSRPMPPLVAPHGVIPLSKAGPSPGFDNHIASSINLLEKYPRRLDVKTDGFGRIDVLKSDNDVLECKVTISNIDKERCFTLMNLTVKPALRGLSWKHDMFPRRLEAEESDEFYLTLDLDELFEGEQDSRANFTSKYISSLLLIHYLGPMPGFSDTSGLQSFPCIAFSDAGTLSGYIFNSELVAALNPRAEPFVPSDFHAVLAYQLRDRELDSSMYHRARSKGLPVAMMSKTRLSDVIENHNRLQALPVASLDSAQVEESLPKHFTNLLALEEGQHHRDVANYAIADATVRLLRKEGCDFAILKVPGLSENCPLINIGDCVRLRSFVYTDGRVLDVKSLLCRVHSHHGENSLLLRIPTATTPPRRDAKLNWTAEFQHDTVQFAVMRKACQATILKHLQYPAEFFANHPRAWEAPLKFHNTELNAQQEIAVRSVLARTGQSMSPPLIIHGPPGTGKTVTVCESIFQVLRAYPEAHILAAAPSNAAADVLCTRLADMGLPADELLRLNWLWRPLRFQKTTLLPFSCMDAKFPDVFGVPTKAALSKARVIVSTCMSACMLRNKGVSLTHIFLDEASQATEPQTYVVLQLATPSTVVVVAGDPCQLGPSVRSERCLGNLDVSYQERLIKTSTYTRPQSPHLVTLKDNYRSHAAIIQLPRQMFYKNELRSCADVRITGSLARWSMVPEEFPLLFYGVDGTCDKLEDSASFYNNDEGEAVYGVIKRLLEDPELDVKIDDFGVMAPFKAQVKLLRRKLRAQDLGQIRVGTIDDYQGQEEKIIIISTTVSPDMLSWRDSANDPFGLDIGPLAMFRNAKRFNVAVTRAKALVVMVGHPTAVSRDQHWGSWLNFCIHHKSYYGCSSPKVPHELSQRGSMDDAAQQAARRVLGQARGNPWAQAFESSEQMQQFHGGETNFRDIM